MQAMFSRCSSLTKLNLPNFKANKTINMRYMFSGCSEQFQNKIRVQYKDIKEEAFNKN